MLTKLAIALTIVSLVTITAGLYTCCVVAKIADEEAEE